MLQGVVKHMEMNVNYCFDPSHIQMILRPNDKRLNDTCNNDINHLNASDIGIILPLCQKCHKL